jgi:hypothetical protein
MAMRFILASRERAEQARFRASLVARRRTGANPTSVGEERRAAGRSQAPAAQGLVSLRGDHEIGYFGSNDSQSAREDV